MVPVMQLEISVFKRFVSITAGLLAALSGVVEAQTLNVETLPNGTSLVHVAVPMSEATTLAWAEAVGGRTAIRSVTGGALTLTPEAEASLTGEGPAPPVVVAVGSSAASDLRSLLGRLLGGRAPIALPPAEPVALVEGGVDRRLGPPGSDASLRLVVPFPPASAPDRSSVEVLWELLPAVLSGGLEGLQSRVDGESGVLELRVDPDLAEQRLRRIRLEIARLASSPQIDDQVVESARTRVEVRRLARLEQHPEGAEALVRRWLAAGDGGVREMLFGTAGVTADTVRVAASGWLARHPGAGQLLLPPRVFDPRFAAGPQRMVLGNDLVASVLERPAAPLATVVLRPVLVPDVDGALSATVLARVAAELRARENGPGWLVVRADPPSLELAGPPEAFPELVEGLRGALERVVADDTPVTPAADDARRRTLELVGMALGLTGTGDLSPAVLLRPANLVLGAVVPDAEAAGEALAKLLVTGLPAPPPISRAAGVGLRRREGVAGSGSAYAVVLEVDGAPGRALPAVLAGLLSARAGRELEGLSAEVVTPLVPGRQALVLLVEGTVDLDALERRVAASWTRLTAPTTEEELTGVRRRTAVRLAAETGGVLGRARTCAAIAAGEQPWQTAREVELDVLGTGVEEVAPVLGRLADLAALETVGAGVLPIVDPAEVEQPRRR